MTEQPLSDESSKKVETARAGRIKGLGDRPPCNYLSVKDSPRKMLRHLKDRYTVSNTTTRVQLQSKLSRMSDKGQSMLDHVESFEEIFNRLAAINGMVAEDLQVARLLASFRDKNRSQFGFAIPSLQMIQENLDWETTTATLIQEYEKQIIRSDSRQKTSKEKRHPQAVRDGSKRRRQQFWKTNFCSMKRERKSFYKCEKVGNMARNCFSKG